MGGEERLRTVTKDEGWIFQKFCELVLFFFWKWLLVILNGVYRLEDDVFWVWRGLKEEGDDKGYLCHYIMKFSESICFNPNEQRHMGKNSDT
jgi:hypothetical protein